MSDETSKSIADRVFGWLFPDYGTPLAELYRFMIALGGFGLALRPPTGADQFHFWLWLTVGVMALWNAPDGKRGRT